MKKEQLLVGGKRGGNKQASKVPRKGEKVKLFLNSHLLLSVRENQEGTKAWLWETNIYW